MENPPREIFLKIQMSLFLNEDEGGEEGREGEGNRHTRDKTPCSSLADAAN